MPPRWTGKVPQKADALTTLRRSRLEANEFAKAGGRKRLTKVLTRAQRELNSRLRTAEGLQGKGVDTFTTAQMRSTLGQVEDIVSQLNTGVERVATDQASIAAGKSARGLIAYMEKSSKKYGTQAVPLKKAAMLDAAVSGSNASVLRRLAATDSRGLSVLQRYGVGTIAMFENELQQALIQKLPWAAVRGNLISQSSFLQGQPAHWAERIVRTETMAAYNRAGTESIRTANRVLGDMVRILSATFDGRTGWDS